MAPDSTCMARAWHVLSPAMGSPRGPRVASLESSADGPHRRVAPALPAAALTARKSDCRRSSVSIALAACAHIAPFHPRHQSTRGARAAHVCRSTPATAASVRSSPGSEPRRIQAVRSNRHTTPTSSVDNVSKPPGSSSSVKSKGNGMCVEVVTKTRPQRFRCGVRKAITREAGTHLPPPSNFLLVASRNHQAARRLEHPTCQRTLPLACSSQPRSAPTAFELLLPS